MESSEMSVGDESSQVPSIMDDIQQSIMKAQKAKRNKQKKQKKKQKKIEKEAEEAVEHPNPILGHILSSFTAEENTVEML
jgi:isocitrate lyase